MNVLCKEIKSYKDLDIGWLKNNCERLYYFGLGFIQLKINEEFRIHFYTDKLPTITDTPHNHRYDFDSLILKGEFKNILYKEEKGNNWVIDNESCNPDIEAPKETKEVSLVKMSETVYSEGESYHMYYKDFHSVFSESCITLLKRSEYKQDYAQVSRKKGEKTICPFSMTNIPEEDLWKIIEEML